MTEKEENIVEVPQDSAENISENMEDMPVVSENIPADSGESNVSSDSLYDKLVEDIADKLKEDSFQNETDEISEEISVNPDDENTGYHENNGSELDIPVFYDLTESETVLPSNDISSLLEYLEGREVNTSMVMHFGDARISDLSVTDGLLLIVLILFLFRWLYDFGKGVFS